MTPFGEKLRQLRDVRDIRQRDMAAALQVSPAYLSALEHGRRGAPSAGLIHQICDYLGLIWDDADELKALAKLSRPRLKMNAAGLTPEQTALANRLTSALRDMSPETVASMHQLLDEAASTEESLRPSAKTTVKLAKEDQES